MKKKFLAALATGFFLVGMVGLAQALTINNGTTEVGDKDILLFSTALGNSGEATELEWVQDVLNDTTIVMTDKYDTNEGAGWVAVDNKTGYFAHQLYTDPAWFLIKTGNLQVTDNDTFLFQNNSLAGYGVVELLDMGFAMKDIINVSKISHVGEFNGTTPVPEPATMVLLGAGLFGLIGVTRRRKKK
ncbi:PEP-CTERM sorting domain-containing protein [Desulfocastanea catecholica]